MVTKDRKKSSKDTKPLSLGGTAIAFPTGGSAQGNFVVASEGGKILRCLIKKHRSEISTRGDGKLVLSDQGKSSNTHFCRRQHQMEQKCGIHSSSSTRGGPSQSSKARGRVGEGEESAGGLLIKRLRIQTQSSKLGDIFQWKTKYAHTTYVPQELLFPSPIDFSFHSHVGPVHSLEFSPFHRNLFLSCGSDGSARIYSLLQVRRSWNLALTLF